MVEDKELLYLAANTGNFMLSGRPKAKASNGMITSIILVSHRPSPMLFELASTFSYVYTYFSSDIDVRCESLTVPIRVSTLVGNSSVVGRVLIICRDSFKR